MRVVLIIGFILVNIFSLNAQSKFSLRANISTGLYGMTPKTEIDYPQWKYREAHIYLPKLGVGTALELAYQLTDEMNVSTALAYQFYLLQLNKEFQYYDAQSVVYFEDTWLHKHQMHTLQLPVKVSYIVLDRKIKMGVHIAFAPSFLAYSRFEFYEDEQYNFNANTQEEKLSFEKKIDFLLSAGVSLIPHERVELRLNFEKDLGENNLTFSEYQEDVWVFYKYAKIATGLELELSYKLQKKSKKQSL